MDNINIKKEIRFVIKKGNLVKLKEIIEGKPELINMVTAFGTWLHVAATHGKLEIVKYLVHSGIDIDAEGGGSECAAIKSAASEGHLEVVKCLLRRGANMNVTEAYKNPLFGAIYGGHYDIVKFLVENGIDFSVKYNINSLKNVDAYEYARQFGQVEIANYLKEKLKNKSN